MIKNLLKQFLFWFFILKAGILRRPTLGAEHARCAATFGLLMPRGVSETGPENGSGKMPARMSRNIHQTLSKQKLKKKSFAD